MRTAARDWAFEMAEGGFLAHASDITGGVPDGWTAGTSGEAALFPA